ncbi:hypothetical protein SRB5_08280 [Streptomyces sp. RB5]|uniref:Integral membrane bound transporter domain-containing protein n=1 Tax=Streptomyces smaragdinus TaxID=2585196 RepID=A0A7K0CB97_9ACTN|nr:FUSC family protein [Streptomyces smaragdinus]MQY10715.1 hypothetical protein [Streptomyces smaragdinus]
MSKMWQRIEHGLWPILQQVLAVVIAWWLARVLLDAKVPIFSPIAALVALNTPRGARGANAVRVVLGVMAGVFIGDVAYRYLGHGAVSIALAVLCAMLFALVVDGQRVTMGQCGVSAVIAVVWGQQAAGERVLEVLIGGGVALVFSQLLFPAHPLATLRRAEATMLEELVDVLATTARALQSEREEQEEKLWERLRPGYGVMADLVKAREQALTLTRTVPAWWGQEDPVRQEGASAMHLDLLVNSCMTLARTAMSVDPEHRPGLAPAVKELARILRLLSKAPGNRAVRARAVERVLRVVRIEQPIGSGPRAAFRESVRMVGRDIMVFAGASDETADRSLRELDVEVPIVTPPRLRRPYGTARPRPGRRPPQRP